LQGLCGAGAAALAGPRGGGQEGAIWRPLLTRGAGGLMFRL